VTATHLRTRADGPVVFGYARTAAGQSPVSQIRALLDAGVDEDDLYVERAAGSATVWPEQQLLIRALRRGDTVKATRLDRLFYSVQHLILLGTQLRERGIRLQAIEQDFDSESLEGRDLFGMLSSLNELHLQFVAANTNDGLANARARGRIGGRPPSLTDAQVVQVLQDHAAGIPIPQLAQRFRCSRATIYRHIALANPEHPIHQQESRGRRG
jgi:DNA invertase Pin-like site-specific DNA recombinase